MQLKYADDLRQYQNCPPPNASPHAREAFRYVHSPIENGKNFLPAAKLNPKRKLRPNEHCICLALSMYVSRESAIARYAYLSSEHENFHKTAGHHLARGVLDEVDGCACHYREDGHFSFFESSTADLSPKFTITENLAP